VNSRILIAVVALVVGVVIGVVMTKTGDDSPSSTAAVTTTTTAHLSADARALVRALDAGRHVTFHAAYHVAPPDGSSSGQTIDIDVWRKGDKLRQDTVSSGGTQDGHVAAFFLGDDITSCSQPVGGGWTCQRAARGQVPGPEALTAELTGQLEGVSVRTSQETVSGVESTCYLLEIPSEAAKVCVRSDGVPTLIASGLQLMQLTVIEDNVDDSVFAIPAAVA
jgi:hypothetical protein